MISPALQAIEAAGLTHRVIHDVNVNSIEDAARTAGVELVDVLKTIVVRRSADEFVFVLVPGGRAISWPKLRAVLSANRLSLPDAATAQQATGYVRGTITPFGSATAWPVVADERVAGRTVRLGAGVAGTAVVLAADDAVRVLDATLADVTEPAPG